MRSWGRSSKTLPTVKSGRYLVMGLSRSSTPSRTAVSTPTAVKVFVMDWMLNIVSPSTGIVRPSSAYPNPASQIGPRESTSTIERPGILLRLIVRRVMRAISSISGVYLGSAPGARMLPVMGIAEGTAQLAAASDRTQSRSRAHVFTASSFR